MIDAAHPTHSPCTHSPPSINQTVRMASKTTTNSARLEAALDLARRMPPAAAPEVLNSLLTLLLPKGETALAEELVERVEQPLEEALDERAVRDVVSQLTVPTFAPPTKPNPTPSNPFPARRAGPSC